MASRTRTAEIQSALATLVSLKPENELEGMLLGQMIACNLRQWNAFAVP